MNVLYISYWGIGDPLTTASVMPSLKILAPYAKHLYLATIERGENKPASLPGLVIHLPFYSFSRLPRFAEKISDLIRFSIKLLLICKRKDIDLIICRGAMAAIFPVFLHRLTRLPFLVESFEPHADYMLEGNTWKNSQFEYKFQRWIEGKAATFASVVMPVSYSYADHLARAGVPEDRIVVMPCCVDNDKFKFNPISRMTIREHLRISEDITVGIYVGKFGDLYWNHEAYHVFKQCNDFFGGKFFLIILSQQDANNILEKLRAVEFPSNRAFVASVSHELVPEYLSASDFSFSLARFSPSRRFLSPIKNGEYWANGLPILLSRSVADDETLIIENNAGAVFDLNEASIDLSLRTIQQLIRCGRDELAKKISAIAAQRRSFEIIENGYKKIFEQNLKYTISNLHKG